MKTDFTILHYTTSTTKMIGYKVAHSTDEKRVIITLDIPDDACTNMNRTDIVNKDTAKYRTNKATVLSIEDENGNMYETATSSIYTNKPLTYKVGETLVVDDYDTNIETVCSSGIHYFLNKRVAELYNLPKIENGLYQQWHTNGQKRVECTYVNDKPEGLYRSWHYNGQKWVECTNVNGKCEGLCQQWHTNGHKRTERTYVNGKLEGLYQSWYENGQKREQCTFINGNLEGLCQTWYPTGNKRSESTYVNGKLEGLYQEWHENGQKWVECTYVNGIPKGLHRSWHENGTKNMEYTYS